MLRHTTYTVLSVRLALFRRIIGDASHDSFPTIDEVCIMNDTLQVFWTMAIVEFHIHEISTEIIKMLLNKKCILASFKLYSCMYTHCLQDICVRIG
jgi:hypothetical protein